MMTPRLRNALLIACGLALALFAAWSGARREHDEQPAATTGDVHVARPTETAGNPSVPNQAPIDPRLADEPVDAITAALDNPRIFIGVIEEATGDTPEREGVRCRLGIEKMPSTRDTCRVVFECGRTRLLGAPPLHNTPCVFEGDDLRSISDTGTTAIDRDPSLTYDGETQTLNMQDDRFGMYGRFSISLHVAEASASEGTL